MLNFDNVKSTTQKIFDGLLQEIKGLQVMQDNLEERIDELDIDFKIRIDIANKVLSNLKGGYVGYTVYKYMYNSVLEDMTKKYGKDFELYPIKTINNIETVEDLYKLFAIAECLIMIGINDILSQYSQAIYHISNTYAIFHNQDRIVGFIRDLIAYKGKITYHVIKEYAKINNLVDFDCEDILNILKEFVLFDKNNQKLIVENIKELSNWI